MTFFRTAAVALALAGIALTAPKQAAANDHHGWHGHGHWSGPPYHGFYRPYWRPHGYYPPRAAVVVWAPAPIYPAYPAYPVAPAPVAEPVIQAVPGPEFRDETGRYCREYQRAVVINGQTQQVYGTACLMPDGAWRIVS